MRINNFKGYSYMFIYSMDRVRIELKNLRDEVLHLLVVRIEIKVARVNYVVELLLALL
jgi:hypothetical protein